MRQARWLAFSGRLSGTVVSWHPFERRGVIRCEVDGREYTIPNARAFETILPTHLNHLEGAKVEFEAFGSVQDVDRVITRSRLEPITSRSYAQTNPVDFLAGFRLDTGKDVVLETSLKPSAPRVASASSLRRLAGSITVDLSTLTPARGAGLVQTKADVLGEMEAESKKEEEEEEAGVRPPRGVKDLRNLAVLDADTKELLRLRRQLGDEAKARRALQQQRREAETVKMQQRKVLATHQTGVVLAWSSMYRSGVLLENATELPAGGTASDMQNICIIRNVEAFDTALPTSLNLVGRVVTFVKVAYTSHPSKVFAENICVCGEVNFDEAQIAAANEKAQETTDAQRAKRAKQLGTLFSDTDCDYDDEPLPVGPLYGVVTRWSGGQGVVETASRRLYYIQSAANFKQLVDHSSTSIRGAVVSFTVDSENRRNVREVNILSLATRSLADVMPMLERPGRSTHGTTNMSTSTDVVDSAGLSVPTNSNGGAENVAGEPPSDVAWVHGVLITWSPLEDQGVIESDDGNRYLLRDGEEHVRDYKACKPRLQKGRRVKFTAFGGTGRLACNVVLLLGDGEDEAISAEEEELSSSGGCVEEAIASPTSTAYWISRMDRAGYDTTEVKQMQNRAITFDDDNDGDEKLLDSEDLFKKDHWFNDPRKNIRFPNSDMTAGNLALIGPASMMNIAMKTRDPGKLEKLKNKYYNRLTEPMKEFAWKQAKELAPKYEKRLKEAREKGEEPRFSFY